MAPCLSRSVHQIIRGLHALNFDGLMLQSDMYFLVGFVTVLFGAPARQVRCARFAAFRGRGAVSQPVLLPHGHPGDEFRHGNGPAEPAASARCGGCVRDRRCVLTDRPVGLRDDHHHDAARRVNSFVESLCSEHESA